MPFPIKTIQPEEYPTALHEIPQPPKQLYLRGAPIDTKKKMIAIVGARRHSEYARQACEKIVSELKSYPVSIVSGLAIGIDAIAHHTALRANISTIAVIGSGLNESVLYPATNRGLAENILKNNGTLITEYEPKARATKYAFPARNRIMAGISELVIAIECGMQSGTRITTRLATEYNKEVGAVPHNIFSKTGAGTNELIKLGAHVIRCGDDVAEIVGLK